MGSSELIVKRVTIKSRRKYRILLHSKQTHLESTNSHTHLPTQCHKLQIANFQPSLMTDSLHTIFGVDIAGGRTFAPHMSSCHIHMFDHISKGWASTFHGLSGRSSPLASLVPRSHGLRPLAPSPLPTSRREDFFSRFPGAKKAKRAPAMQASYFQDFNNSNACAVLL